jgi:hypothetical protein
MISIIEGEGRSTASLVAPVTLCVAPSPRLYSRVTVTD